MLWFAGLLLGPVTCPFTPLASQCVWELQYVTKDINSTLPLYLKHSPLPGNQSFSLSIKKLPSRKVQRKKKNRKEATAVSSERKEQGGATPRAPCGPSLLWSCPWLGCVRKPRRMPLLGTVNHCTCAQAVHTSASWPAPLTCPSTLAKTHTPRKPRRFPLCLRPPFLFLWFYMFANWLDLLSFPRCVKRVPFLVEQRELKARKEKKALFQSPHHTTGLYLGNIALSRWKCLKL